MDILNRLKEQINKATKQIYGYTPYKETEAITEANVYADAQNGLYIALFGDDNRYSDLNPYFKVSWRRINKNNTDVARISMVTGDYVIHYKRTVKLERKEIDAINKLIASEDKNYDGRTFWEALLQELSLYTESDYETLKKRFPKREINPVTIPKGTSIIKWKG